MVGLGVLYGNIFERMPLYMYIFAHLYAVMIIFSDILGKDAIKMIHQKVPAYVYRFSRYAYPIPYPHQLQNRPVIPPNRCTTSRE